MTEKPTQKVPVWPSFRRLLKLSGPHQDWFYGVLLVALVEAGVTIAWNLTLARFVANPLGSLPPAFASISEAAAGSASASPSRGRC